MKLTKAETAEILGISVRQLDNLVVKGLPKRGKFKQTSFDAKESVAWYMAYKIEQATPSTIKEDAQDLTAAQLRKTNADATLAEMKVAQQRGEVVSIADAERAIAQMIANMRARLLALPAKVSPIVSNCSSKTKNQATIAAEVEHALAELATTAGDITLEEPRADVPDHD